MRNIHTNATEILLDQNTRDDYLKKLFKMDGLSDIHENKNSAYCAISLTNTPDSAKAFCRKRQDLLVEILKKAGISAYDPSTAPLSPDIDLSALPLTIYRSDITHIVSSRFFTAFDTFPSTGMGVEFEAARRYNRIAVIMHDKGIRTSRMQPDCAIHIQIEDIDSQRDELIKLFVLLKQYEPGRGLVNKVADLLGFKGKRMVSLPGLVKQKFPSLVYTFDGTKPALQFAITNADLVLDNG